MATEVKHQDPLVKELALEYISGLEDLIAAGFGEFTSKVVAHEHLITERDNLLRDRKRFTKPAKRG